MNSDETSSVDFVLHCMHVQRGDRVVCFRFIEAPDGEKHGRSRTSPQITPIRWEDTFISWVTCKNTKFFEETFH